MCMCIDYRALNKIAFKDSFPLPHPEDLISKLHGMYRFTNLDFWSGFHQYRCHQDSIEKTAFIGPDALYEWLVVSFGSANAPSEFMRLMANQLLEHIDKGCYIVFIDNILIFSKNDEDHERHVGAVMDTIGRAGFRLHGSKYSFGRTSAPFLGFDISGDDPDGASVCMTHEKVKAIADWPFPASLNDLFSFVGFAGVYRTFVPHFAKISAPLMELLTADQQGFDACKADATRWTRVTTAIDFLKAAMIRRPALALPLPQRNNYNFRIGADASDWQLGLHCGSSRYQREALSRRTA